MTAKIRVGSREASYGGKLESAARAGADGVELGCGGPAPTLRIADPHVREDYKQKCKDLGLAVSSLSMDLLNDNPVASDPSAAKWIEQTIDAAKDLGARSILVPFFGRANLVDSNGPGGALKKADLDAIVPRMKEVAPKAQEAHICLGLENYLSATQNLDLLERIGSPAVGVWYDIGNSTHAGYDVPSEIRQLKGRICTFHFKDGPNYLGEGKIKLEPIADAIRDIGYEGWIVLETSCPSKDCEADCRRNIAVVKKLFGLN